MNSITSIFGKVLSYYDSFNGDRETVTISKIELADNSFIFSGVGYWGNEQKIYVPMGKVDTLIETGKATSETTIDHCFVTTEWSLK